MTQTISILEEVWCKAHNSKLTEEFFCTIEKKATIIKGTYNINPIQCVATALLLNSESLNLTEIGEYVGLPRISILQYADELDELVKRRMLLKEEMHFRGKRTALYRLTANFEKALRQGKPIETKPYELYTLRDLCNDYKDIRNLCTTLYDDDLDEEFYNEFHPVIVATKHLPTVVAIEELHLPQEEWLFMWALVYESICNNGNITCDDLDAVMGEDCACEFWRELSRNGTIMQQEGLIEPCPNQGFADNTAYRLTIRGYEELLPNANCPQLTKIQALSKNLKKPSDIEYKELYFNDYEQKQIDKLVSLLQQENYNSIVERMEEEGLRTGFCCLFYGGPGTGKTELVYQLAKSTNRGIFQVDISTVRDKFVGESEKIIKSYFTRYKKMVKAQRKVGKLEPIMLLNEADAILTQRKVKSLDAVDKMENSVQNIILQALEDLDGILIATTNLTANLDDAFERRFLYKLEFAMPNVDTRAKIIGSMLPELSEEEAYTLAKSYSLSGGQLENIRRKAQVDYILTGSEPTLVSLSDLCEQENLKKQTNKKIGFC